MRLKLVPDNVKFDYFHMGRIWLGIPVLAVFLSFVCLGVKGLNFGIDFLGGTTMRAETPNAMDIGKFRDALEDLLLGDVIITEV
ncbi:MAG TPA: protein translocase subunit SecF, partial [Paenirhodobacter sp.]